MAEGILPTEGDAAAADTSRLAVAVAATAAAAPLTERILARLPGARGLWVPVWASVALAIPVVAWWIVAIQFDPDPDVSFFLERLPRFGGEALGILIALVGTQRIASRLQRVGPTIARLSEDPSDDAAPLDSFRMGSTLAPVTFAIVLALVTTIDDIPTYGPLVVPLVGPVAALSYIPLMTVLWCYIAVLLRLDRLGREPLRLTGFPEDPSLGLGPVGALAFAAFAAVALTTLPFLIVVAHDLEDFLIALGIFAFTLGLLMLAMWRLHGRILEVKERHVADARRIYAEAYAPIAADPSLALLAERANELRTADLLLTRAQSILEWPIDPSVVGRLVAVSTGVVTALASTFVLRQIGI